MRGRDFTVIGAAFLMISSIPIQTAWADQEKVFNCPEQGDPYETVKCYDNMGKLKPGFPRDDPKPFKDGEDVNNDGKKDRLGSSMKDAKGNAIECWCLQKSDKTGQQFAYAFVPADGSGRKWFGGCYFKFGYNTLKCDGEVIKEGPMKGMIKEYTKVTQINIDLGAPPPMPPTGTKDKHFCYFNSGPTTGKIQKNLTEGQWKPVAITRDGKVVYQYMTMKSTPCPIQDPPKTPQELLASVFGINPNDPDAVAALGDFGGYDQPAAVLIADATKRPQLEYRLMVPPTFTFSADTLVAGEVTVHQGDELTITGSRVEGAFVAGDAAALDRGGWVLVAAGPEYATFRATSTAQIEPGVPFGPFVLVSEALPGPVTWAYQGRDIAMSASTGMPETVIKPNPTPIPVVGMENSHQ